MEGDSDEEERNLYLIKNFDKFTSTKEIALSIPRVKMVVKMIEDTESYFARVNKFPKIKSIVKSACIFGNTDTLNWINSSLFHFRSGKISLRKFDYFAKKDVKMVQNLKHLHRNACVYATKGGQLNNLECLRQFGSPWDKGVCEEAARQGYLNMLKYAHENGCPWDPFTFSEAAEYGRFEIVKYAHEKGCPARKGIMSDAVTSGSLEMVKYLHQNGYPWNEEYTCAAAVTWGHFEILKYACENGCPWDYDTYCMAIKYDRFDMLQYAFDNNCPLGSGYAIIDYYERSNNEEIRNFIGKNILSIVSNRM